MPNVPSELPKVVPQFSNPRGISETAFGSPQAKAISNTGRELDRLAMQARIEDQSKQVAQYEIEYKRRKREYMMGTDENPGIAHMQGQTYLDNMPRAMEDMRKIREDILSGIQDSHVRDAFGDVSASLEEQQFLGLSQDAVTHQRSASLEVQLARRNEVIDDAIVSRGSDDFMIAGAAAIKASVLEEARITGTTDPKVIKETQEEALSSMVKGVVESEIANNRGANALAVLKKWEDKIDPPVAAALHAQLKNVALTAEAQSIVDEAFKKFDSNEDIRKYVAEQTKNRPELREEAQNTAHLALARRETDRNIRHGDAVSQGLGLIQEGTSTTELRNKNPDLFDEIARNSTDFANILATEQRVAEGKRWAVTSKEGAMANFERMSPQDLVQVNTELWAGNLTKEDHSRLERMVGGAADSLNRASASNSTYEVAEGIFRQEWMGSENWGKGGPADREEQNTIRNAFHEWADPLVRAGTPPGPADIRDKIKDLIVSWEDKRAWQSIKAIFGNDNKYTAFVQSMSPEERSNFYVPYENVPQEWRDKYSQLLKDNNQPVTEDRIQELFGAELLGDLERGRRVLNPKEPAQRQLNLGGAIGAGDVQPILEMLSKMRRSPIVAPPVPEAKPLGKAREAVTLKNEGLVTQTYLDTLGVPTIGVGFNLNRAGSRKRIEALGYNFSDVKSGKTPISEADSRTLFAEDLKAAESDARALVPNFDNLLPDAQTALVDMSFNLGKSKLGKFKKMIKALAAQNYEAAAVEAQNSQWFKQVGNRGPLIVKLLRGK